MSTMLTPKEITSVSLANATRRPERSASAPRTRQRAELIELERAGTRYWHLKLTVPPPFLTAHIHPAQYITLRVGEMEPRYVALANSPDDPHWELLIDRDSSLGRALDPSHHAAREIHVSPPEGLGFAIDEPDHTPLILFTTGSGIATMRGVIQWLLANHPSQLAHTHLYYGELDELAIAYKEEIDTWRDAGVHVTFAFDSPTAQDYPWRFVQQPFAAHPPSHSISRGTFLMSGSAVMLRFASETLLKMGVAPERLLFNV